MTGKQQNSLYIYTFVLITNYNIFMQFNSVNKEDFHWQPFSIVYSILVDMLSLKVEQFLEKNDKIITALQKKTKIKQDWMTG